MRFHIHSYEFIGFGAMDVTKPYKFIEFGAMDVTKPYEFIRFGAIEQRDDAGPDPEIWADITTQNAATTGPAD